MTKRTQEGQMGRPSRHDRMLTPDEAAAATAAVLPLPETDVPGLRLVESEQRTVPPVPRRTGKEAREVWHRIWMSDVADAWDWDTHYFLVERYIRYVDQWAKVTRTIVNEGAFVAEGSMGQPVEHPLLKLQRSVEREVSKMEHELGLTPRARASIGLTSAQTQLTAAHINAMVNRAQLEPVEKPDKVVVDVEGWEEA